MGVDREPLGPECRQKDGSRPPGLAFAHERGTLVRHPRGPTGYKAVRRNAARTQRGRSRYRPHSASRGEEATLDTISLIQGLERPLQRYQTVSPLVGCTKATTCRWCNGPAAGIG